MTEREWLVCEDPEEMWQHTVGKGDRKHALFHAACCRRVWHLLRDERSRKAVVMLESYADGGADFFEVSAANDDADAVCDSQIPRRYADAADAVVRATLLTESGDYPDKAAVAAADAASYTVKSGKA